MGIHLNYPKFRASDSRGRPLSGGKLHTYIVGTTTEKPAYSDYNYNTQHTNPIVLDADGEATIYLLGPYKLILKDSNDVEIWTMDNVYGQDSTTGNVYYPYNGATDQGATGNSDTIKYAVDTLGSDTGTIKLLHNSGSATTTYTLTTSETTGSTIYFEIEPGAIIDGAGTLTIESPSRINAGKKQNIFGTSITVVFTNATGEEMPVEWWGTDDAAIVSALTCANASAGSRTGDMWANEMSHATVTLSTDVNIDATITQPTKTLFTMAPGASLIRNFNGDLWKIDTSGTRIGRIQFDHSEYTSALAADNTAALVINTSTDVDDNVPIDEIRSYGNDYASGAAVRGAVIRFDATAHGSDDFYFNHWKKIVANFSKYLFYWNVTEGGGTAGIKGNIFGPIFIDRIRYLWYDKFDGTTTCKFSGNYLGPIIYEGGNNADYLPDASTFDFVDGDVTVAADTIDEVAHGIDTGTPVRLTTTGTLPAGLSLLTNYYVISASADTIQLATTKANAHIGTNIDITAAAGGGTHTLTSIAGLFDMDGATGTINGNTFDGAYYDVDEGYLFQGLDESGEKNLAYISILGESFVGQFKGKIIWKDSTVPNNIFPLHFTALNIPDDTAGTNVSAAGNVGTATSLVLPFDCWIRAIGMYTADKSATSGTIEVYHTASGMTKTFTITNGTNEYYTEFAYSDGYTLSAGDSFRPKVTTANLNTADEDLYVSVYLVPMKN
jgi:hypothetical protein